MFVQDYGLFPWLNVRDNIGFGPKSRGRTKADIRETSDRFIELVGLQNFADVYPHTGSTCGGRAISQARSSTSGDGCFRRNCTASTDARQAEPREQPWWRCTGRNDKPSVPI